MQYQVIIIIIVIISVDIDNYHDIVKSLCLFGSLKPYFCSKVKEVETRLLIFLNTINVFLSFCVALMSDYVTNLSRCMHGSVKELMHALHIEKCDPGAQNQS